MFAQFSRLLTYTMLFGVLLLFACSAKPVLISKSAAVPVGVDLSGNWLIRKGSKAERVSVVGEDGGIRIPTSGSQRHSNGGGSRGGKSAGASARVFLEFGESLKITQTFFGLFISYDRSVVEEYSYGENGQVTVGPIEATRVSGWEGQSFVVETLDDTGTILFESWHLEEDAAVLIRDIRISRGEKDSFVHQQIFDRQ